MKAIVQSGVKMFGIWIKIGCKRCNLSDGSLCYVLFVIKTFDRNDYRLSKTSQSEKLRSEVL